MTSSAIRIVVAATCLFCVCLPRVDACIACLSMPQTTAADRLIEGEVVVFAREDPDKAFSFQAIEVLKGTLDSTTIDLFVDSPNRRRLEFNKHLVIVLVRDRTDRAWRTVGIADNSYQQVVRRILAVAQEWTGPTGAEKRCEFFLTLFGHENRALSELAYLELGRAPYRTIKRFGRHVSRKDLQPFLQHRDYIQWRSLAILLLSQSADAQDRASIDKNFADCCEFSLTTDLAAWATAYIELNGASAIELMEQEYFSKPGRADRVVRELVIAISIHRQDGNAQLHDQIVRSLEIANRNYPEVTQQIAIELAKTRTR
jgi:hypothetical protein